PDETAGSWLPFLRVRRLSERVFRFCAIHRICGSRKEGAVKVLELPDLPVLKRHLRVEHREPDHVFILDELTSHVLSGSSYDRLVPLLDGSRTVDDLVQELPEEDPLDLLCALQQLAELGLLTSRRKDLSAEQEVFWQAFDGQPGLVPSSVELLTFGDIDETFFISELSQAGVTISGAGSQLLVVLVEN